MPAALERTRAGVDAGGPPLDDPHRGTPSRSVADGGEPPVSGGDEGRPSRGVPAALALTIVILVAVLLTYLGMLTQIWANLSGAQLPGA